MRIASDSRLLIAVVTLAACALGYRRETRSANSSMESYESWAEDSSEGGSSTGWKFQENMLLLQSQGLPLDCCPSTLEMIEPKGGINQDGMYVVLFSEGESKQRFYELSCRSGVENKPCQFMAQRHHNQSRCVQKYSYSYAIVERRKGASGAFNAGGTDDWMLDYIRVRSGCSCEVVLGRGKRKRNRPRGRGKGRRSED